MRLDNKGFTLIEVIVSLVVSAVLGTILMQFIFNNVALSVQPVNQTKNIYYSQQVMENIISEYKYLMATDQSPLESFQTKVGNEGASIKNSFGEYEVILNRTITIDNSKFLKIKIKAGGLVLVNIFGG